MNSLHNKHVVLGVTGSIAAYKSADLVRRLRDAGARVRVVLTDSGARFITPLTLQSLSGFPVQQHLLDTESEANFGHIELARWADAVLVAPASANVLARLAHGHADDLLTTLCLATTAPVAVAPAMNHRMWAHAATQDNVQRLVARGVRVFGPDSGDQACGETGPGRMLEPQRIVEQLTSLFETGALAGVRVLVTAGPTQEDVDPVRYIGNRSSGKMGFAVARAAYEAGAAVTVIAGPVAQETPPDMARVDVRSAQQMFDAVMQSVTKSDIFVGAAAVADYRPRQAAAEKIKKSDESLTLELVRNPDIVASVAALPNKPFTVGFAAETHELKTYAQAKLRAKNLDLIAANKVGPDQGFESDENALLVLWPGGEQDLARDRKDRLARALIALIAKRYRAARI
jgi:phosphopantothenoylcysteine decarboxylase/phosphopantothenate--cysteine ligase